LSPLVVLSPQVVLTQSKEDYLEEKRQKVILLRQQIAELKLEIAESK
jgi:hypothetical protein